MYELYSRIDHNIARYLSKPKTPEHQAFMAGCRAMMTAMQMLPTDQWSPALAIKNEQHILGLLAHSEELQTERRRQDVRRVLQLYGYNKAELRAFIFDVEHINDAGIAVDTNGSPLEDDLFRPLSDRPIPGWPDYRIEHIQTNQRISREEFLRLSGDEQQNYRYQRYFYLSLPGQPKAMMVSSTDQILMEELIRADILIGDPINRRYLTESCNGHVDAPDYKISKLFLYKGTVLDAMCEFDNLYHRAAIEPVCEARIDSFITNIHQYEAMLASRCSMGGSRTDEPDGDDISAFVGTEPKSVPLGALQPERATTETPQLDTTTPPRYPNPENWRPYGEFGRK